MQPPKEYSDYGCPECPEGIPLCWDTYDAETEMHCYKTPLDNPACDICWQHGNCYQELYVSPSIDEHHFGIIPLHTKVSQKLLRKIRPQVERGFENDKNEAPRSKLRGIRCHAGLDPASSLDFWIPAFAGMTTHRRRGV